MQNNQMKKENNAIQGDFDLRSKLVDDRDYFTSWKTLNGNGVACEIKQGKLQKFLSSTKEIGYDAVEYENQIPIDDHLKQEEITLTEFLNFIKSAIQNEKT